MRKRLIFSYLCLVCHWRFWVFIICTNATMFWYHTERQTTWSTWQYSVRNKDGVFNQKRLGDSEIRTRTLISADKHIHWEQQSKWMWLRTNTASSTTSWKRTSTTCRRRRYTHWTTWWSSTAPPSILLIDNLTTRIL